jgi:hypothetical protein
MVAGDWGWGRWEGDRLCCVGGWLWLWVGVGGQGRCCSAEERGLVVLG